MNKTKVKMNNLVYLVLFGLDMSKIVMCNYTKPKNGDNAKLCSIDENRFMVHVKLKDVYEDLVEDVETRFETSSYEVKRPITK